MVRMRPAIIARKAFEYHKYPGPSFEGLSHVAATPRCVSHSQGPRQLTAGRKLHQNKVTATNLPAT